MTRTLINIDLSQAELRVMAILSGDKWLQEALQEDAGDFFDTHLMPVSYPEKYEMYLGSVERWKRVDPVDHKECRTNCKAVVYGLAFGRQAPAIAQALGMKTREAQSIIDAFLSNAYDLDRFRQEIMEAARVPAKRDLLINPFGRRYQSEVVTTKNYRNIQREALSFLPQSTSSDIMLSTAIRIQPTLAEAGYQIFNLVHDAMMIEGDDSGVDMIGQFVGRELRKTGEMVLGNAVPFLSDYSHGPSWSDLS
jgi:DNA polymerase-1